MDQVDVIAVTGTCTPERARYAAQHAETSSRTLVTAARIGMSPDPVAEAQALIPWTDQPGGSVVEFPAAIPPTEIIGRFAHPASTGRLVGLTCVVDAMHLLDDLAREDYVVRPGEDGDREFRSRALATATQIEYATTVVLAGWEPLPTPDLSVVLAVVSALSPRARIRLDPAPFPAPEVAVPMPAVQDRPGWIAVLNHDFAPHMTDARVAAAHIESTRPFHPARLSLLLDEIEQGRFGTILRSAGFCRLATRPGVTAHWEHVGAMLSFPPVASDGDLGDDEELLTAGHDLAFFGLDLDRAALGRALDAASLTDDEFAAGPDAWATYEDPFPAWEDVPG
ncbi:GTP-binding protein [Microbacterium sp. G2-8]|uniref:GTP-binding protein n=1 Tax=Microbacterium sp. G2-8 TaxID=2842454 RepID=UPI001C88F89A|nr:GTP-binding protein [Microbacterium sp. G2-8]